MEEHQKWSAESSMGNVYSSKSIMLHPLPVKKLTEALSWDQGNTQEMQLSSWGRWCD